MESGPFSGQWIASFSAHLLFTGPTSREEEEVEEAEQGTGTGCWGRL